MFYIVCMYKGKIQYFFYIVLLLMSVKKLNINPDFFKMSGGKSKKKNTRKKTISSSLLNKTIKTQ